MNKILAYTVPSMQVFQYHKLLPNLIIVWLIPEGAVLHTYLFPAHSDHQ